MTDVSVIIVSYNVRPFLQRALESLSRAKSGLEVEVIVVDNNSEDTSVEMVRTRFPHVEVIETGANLGFAKANNLALKRASGRYLMLLNPDCVLKEDSLIRLVEFLESNPQAGAAGPKLLNRDGTFQTTSKRGFPTPWAAFCKLSGLSGFFPRSKFFNRYELGHLDPDQTHRVEVLTGAALMIRREVYDQVGGLDEDYFMYGEDIDWCHLIGQAGWEIHYVPASQIIHYKGESTRRSNINREKHFYNAMRLFSRKHSRLDLVTRIAIELGIFFGEIMARLKRSSGVWLPAMVDLLLIFSSLLLVFYLRFTFFPSVWGPPPIPITSAMWLVCLLYAMVTTASLAFLGAYESRPTSIRVILFGVVIGFALVSTVAYFVRPIQFSRAVISMGGALVLTLLPGWRYLMRKIGGGDRPRRVVIVGTDTLAETAARRISSGEIRGMGVVGWIVYNQDELGEEIDGLPVLGTAADLPDLAEEHRLDEALFSSRSASYEDIFRIVTRRPVKGLGIQIIPEGFDSDVQVPLLELELGRGILRRLVRSRAPHLVMRDR